jgi:hypothetical protein
MAEVYPLGQPPDPSGLAAPASATRQALKRLASAGDWAQVLEQAEQALSRPEGRAWLDAQRYALSAMVQAGDADRSAAVAACKALLRGFLADFPDLPRAELSDDTPTANAETRTWLETEILPAAAAAPPPVSAYEPPPQPAPLPTDDGSDAEPDAWTLAVADLRAGRAGEGFQRLRRAVLQATSGRERFRRKLQLAELCLMSKTPRAALPLLEELARQVDEFRLEQWEDEELCARVWGALYRCLRGLGPDNGAADRLQKVYDRLCRLDINLALSYANE